MHAHSCRSGELARFSSNTQIIPLPDNIEYFLLIRNICDCGMQNVLLQIIIQTYCYGFAQLKYECKNAGANPSGGKEVKKKQYHLMYRYGEGNWRKKKANSNMIKISSSFHFFRFFFSVFFLLPRATACFG